jgi:SAM-dependent methyltransferase
MNYEEIFRQRGGAYHRAMQQWPDARRDEFMNVVAQAQPRSGDHVIDIPAGGGYLQRYLPNSCSWHGHEPCASFREDGALDDGLLPLPWPDGFADSAISVAGVHHLDDKRPLLAELHRVLKPGGRLVLADVHRDSAVARFLDDFVGRHNSTGHAGRYLDADTLCDFEASGFTVERAVRTPYCWWFADRGQMGAFCALLFDISRIDATEVADAIEASLGVVHAGDAIGMNWELFTLTGIRTIT